MTYRKFLNELLIGDLLDFETLDTEPWNLPIEPNGMIRSLMEFLKSDFCPLAYAVTSHHNQMWVKLLGEGQYRIMSTEDSPEAGMLKIPRMLPEHFKPSVDLCNYSFALTDFMIYVSKSRLLNYDQLDFSWRVLIK